MRAIAEPFTHGDITAGRVDIDEYHEIGAWYSYMDEDDPVYVRDEDQDLEWRMTMCAARVGREVVAYAVTDEVRPSLNAPCDKQYLIMELGIDPAYGTEECARALFGYLLRAAALYGCGTLRLDVTEARFESVYSLMRAMGAREEGDSLLLSVPGYDASASAWVAPCEGDVLGVVDLCYLYDAGYAPTGESISKAVADGKTLSVHRRTGVVTLPAGVRTFDGTPIVFDSTRTPTLLSFLEHTLGGSCEEEIVLNTPVQTEDGAYPLDFMQGNSAFVFLPQEKEARRQMNEVLLNPRRPHPLCRSLKQMGKYDALCAFYLEYKPDVCDITCASTGIGLKSLK